MYVHIYSLTYTYNYFYYPSLSLKCFIARALLNSRSQSCASASEFHDLPNGILKHPRSMCSTTVKANFASIFTQPENVLPTTSKL